MGGPLIAGRIVMFQPYEDTVLLPAIVVKVNANPATVNLQVFPDHAGGTVYVSNIAEGVGRNTWSWPERESLATRQVQGA